MTKNYDGERRDLYMWFRNKKAEVKTSGLARILVRGGASDKISPKVARISVRGGDKQMKQSGGISIAYGVAGRRRRCSSATLVL